MNWRPKFNDLIIELILGFFLFFLGAGFGITISEEKKLPDPPKPTYVIIDQPVNLTPQQKWDRACAGELAGAYDISKFCISCHSGHYLVQMYNKLGIWR